MKIEKIPLAGYTAESKDKNKKQSTVPENKAADKKDSVQLSEEAKNLQKKGEAAELENIRKKIKDGFYSHRGVIEKAAAGLLKDLKAEDKSNTEE